MKNTMKKPNNYLFVGLVFTLSFLLSSGYINRKPEERYTKVVEKVLPTTVSIVCTISRPKHVVHIMEKEYAKIGGSGVFITPTGHILTCAHLFNLPYTLEEINVETYGGYVLPARLIYKEDNRDLALIKVDYEDSPYSRLGSPRDLKVGEEVIAVGSPLGFDGTVTTGIISALNRDQLFYDMIQMSAPINPGNSGGPLFNLSGEVIGINTLIVSPNQFLPSWSGLGFSVSLSEIYRFLYTFHGIDHATFRRK